MQPFVILPFDNEVGGSDGEKTQKLIEEVECKLKMKESSPPPERMAVVDEELEAGEIIELADTTAEFMQADTVDLIVTNDNTVADQPAQPLLSATAPLLPLTHPPRLQPAEAEADNNMDVDMNEKVVKVVESGVDDSLEEDVTKEQKSPDDDLPKFDVNAPRIYQRMLYERALEENILAVLDTGTGKTLIAVLLIRRMAEDDADKNLHRISVFLAPSVPLVIQQSNYIRQNCDLKVKQYYGALGVDSWTSDKWKEELSAGRVLVMTPAIFESLLRRAYISIDQVNLLIFDECHHARKNAAYNQIMSLYYTSCPVERRPKIFGMTASPVSSNNESQTSIRQLEANLCSRAVTVEDLQDVEIQSRKPSEEIWEYEVTMFQSAFLEQMEELGIRQVEHLRKVYNDTLMLSRELGPWCAENYLRISLWRLYHRLAAGADADIANLFAGESRCESPGGVNLGTNGNGNDEDTINEIPHVDIGGEPKDVAMAENGDAEVDDLESPTKEVDTFELAEESKKMLAVFMKVLGETYGRPESEDPFLLREDCSEIWKDPPLDKLSRKLLTLIDILLKNQSPNLRGIIFTERRITARLMATILKHIDMLSFLQVGTLVGHTATGGGSSGMGRKVEKVHMSVREQREVVNGFRDGTINILVATRVAEEGLDIQPCNLVV
ncbi:hypothetical protein HDU76_000861, partial [Blyttiomyces sp. JEL0837]